MVDGIEFFGEGYGAMVEIDEWLCTKRCLRVITFWFSSS